MKNQNDLIVIGVCAVLSIAAAVTMFFIKREPVALATPSAVVTAEPKFSADTAPKWGDSLPGGGGGSGMGGMQGGFGGGGGKMTFGGMGMGGGGMASAGGGQGGPGKKVMPPMSSAQAH